MYNNSQMGTKKKKKSQPHTISHDQPVMDLPVLSDEFLNQLNEEQLQKLLEHQKMLMAMQ